MSMQQSYANILTAVGEDLNRPGLKDTPIRAAKAFSYLTSGYSKTLEEVTNKAVFPSDNHEMVLVKNIEFYSAHMCMMMRGVGKQESTTRTVSFIGDFKTDKDARREFLSAVPESY